MAHYVYILYSTNHQKYYIGQSADVEKRLDYHNNLAEYSYTSKYRPWVLLLKLGVSNRSVAFRIERYLKKKPRSFLKKLVHESSLQNWIIDQFDRN